MNYFKNLRWNVSYCEENPHSDLSTNDTVRNVERKCYFSKRVDSITLC